jgi:hypothetical protein
LADCDADHVIADATTERQWTKAPDIFYRLDRELPDGVHRLLENKRRFGRLRTEASLRDGKNWLARTFDACA